MTTNRSAETAFRSFPDNFRAVVVGSTGAIGGAVMQALNADPRCGEVVGLARSTDPLVDFEDETSIERAADKVAGDGDIHLLFDATGVLHDEKASPEKSLKQITSASLQHSFQVNTLGPALLLKHFHPLFPRHHKSCFATLSARVGSIGDNALGGWYGYRSSKAALNMIIKTASIEIARSRPHAVCLALHPGTVETPLSAPYAGNRGGFSPTHAARMLLDVIDKADSSKTGTFLAYNNEEIVW